MKVLIDMNELAAWFGGAVMVLCPFAVIVASTIWFWSTRKIKKRKRPKIEVTYHD